MKTRTGLRIASLKLAGLHPDDRQWLLNRLDEDTRQQITGLLSELSSMGVTPGEYPDAEVLADLLAGATSTHAKVIDPWWSDWLLENSDTLSFDERIRVEDMQPKRKFGTEREQRQQRPPLPPAMQEHLKNLLLARETRR